MKQKLYTAKWLIRWSYWEYWSLWWFYIPVYFYIAWLAIWSRFVFFFSSANPNIPLGGLAGESKWDILKHLPAELTPETLYYPNLPGAEQVLSDLKARQIQFPIVCKPDVGERGSGVAKIADIQALQDYLSKSPPGALLVQEYIDLPLEVGILWYKLPNSNGGKGKITSIVIKEFLTVTGDGKHSLEALIRQKPRAYLQVERLKQLWHQHWHQVIPVGKTILLEPIGNHCRGTAFLDGRKYINTELEKVFDKISTYLPEFYYGRFDIRTQSFEALNKGEMKILEINGVTGEPAHIYHPGASIWIAWKTLFQHWYLIYKIAAANRKRGFKPTPFWEGRKFLIENYYRKPKINI